MLQHELQKNAALLQTVYCHHAHILLQDAAPLDVLLRMVPLFKAEQQVAVYQALHSSMLRAEGNRRQQKATEQQQKATEGRWS